MYHKNTTFVVAYSLLIHLVIRKFNSSLSIADFANDGSRLENLLKVLVLKKDDVGTKRALLHEMSSLDEHSRFQLEGKQTCSQNSGNHSSTSSQVN